MALDAYTYKNTFDIVKFGEKEYEVLFQRNLVGFQATLYRDANTNEKILAIRGTDAEVSFNGLDDILNDILLGTLGDNWQTNDLQKFYNDMVETGILSPSDKLTVTGHSLGGYLAQLFTIANEDKISHTYTYNAPGLLGLKGTLLNLFGTSNIKSNKITDILAKDGINFTNAMGLNVGEEIKVSGNSHAIKDLTQILYFYDMAISSGVNENAVTQYLSGFYNTPNFILKGSVASIASDTISQIEQIVGKANGANDIIEICNAYENNNVKFNLNLISPTSSVTSFFSGSNLSTPALYALVNLNPFIISGINSNAYSELERYKDEYSKNYVSDKAKMFKALMDTPKVGSYYDDYETGKKISYYTSVTDPDNTDEYNLTDTAYIFGTNKNDIVTASVGKANRIYTLAGDDTIKLTGGSNYIEAGSGNDTIDLSGIKDTNSVNTIYADIKDSKDDKDSGDDIIIGSSGKDIMYGGAGNDTYKAGDKDIIQDDDDGIGSVEFDGNLLVGGTWNEKEQCYIDDNNKNIKYTLNGNDSQGTLTVKFGDKTLTINNYSKEKQSLNINLAEQKGKEIAIVIDTTGSMQDDIDTAKQTARVIAENIFRTNSNQTQYSKISIVTFSDNSIKTIGTYTTISAFQSGINSVFIENGSQEYAMAALLEGMSNFTPDNGLSKEIYLMTDEPGDDNHRKSEVLARARDLKMGIAKMARSADLSQSDDNSVKINIISINSNLNHFKELSDQTGGSFFQPNSLSELEDALFELSNLGTSKS
ncbi:VWA domain-containing protein, partial [Campylobacter sp. FMV-PI01]